MSGLFTRVPYGAPAYSTVVNKRFHQLDQGLQDWRNGDIVSPQPRLDAAVTLTIDAGGAVVFSQSHHIIAANSGVADDLDTITGGAVGTLLFLYPQSGHTITLRHGVGNIYNKSGADLALASNSYALLSRMAAAWAVVLAVGGVVSRVGVKMRRAANQSIPDNTLTSVTFDSTDYDDGSYWGGGINSTLPAGRWLVKANAEFASNATGFRAAILRIGISSLMAHSPAAVSGAVSKVSVIASVLLTSSTTVGLQVRQNSGGALNVEEAILSAERMST